jgi:hypothetical protein
MPVISNKQQIKENLKYDFSSFQRKKIQYTNLYCSFFLLNNRSDSSLYAPRDGLHLNFAGTSLLRKQFINIIKHVSVN